MIPESLNLDDRPLNLEQDQSIHATRPTVCQSEISDEAVKMIDLQRIPFNGCGGDRELHQVDFQAWVE